MVDKRGLKLQIDSAALYKEQWTVLLRGAGRKQESLEIIETSNC